MCVKSVRGHLSNAEPLAYAGLAGLICLLPACFSEVSCLSPVASQTAHVLHVLPEMSTVFNKQNKCWGTKVPHYPTTPLMSSLTNTSGPFLCRSWRGAREWVEGREGKTGDTGSNF